MAIILRFVDCDGFIRERFFKVLSVADTCSQTLKDEISKVLTQYDLQVENMRGQGYDGASNMRGEYNGLQALFREECPYAYYVHCFAHHLQLTLNAAAKGVHDIWELFSTLNLIVNFVDSSAKRHSALRVIREEEIADLVAAGALETGTGANQTCTLQRAGATRWGSHLHSISSLIKLFGATQTTLVDWVANGPKKVQGEAKSVELDSRFTDDSLEILVLSATFDPRDNFRSFKFEDVNNLALRFYPQDFTSYDMLALDMECEFFLTDIQRDPRFANTTTVSDLCWRLVQSRKSAFFPMIYRLICLVLTLPVSTATTERAFSSMNIIKKNFEIRWKMSFLII
ncbi:putative HAT dimerization domain, ribonuclease H-like domain-containing protein [Rosa chinensis]|uniref:Putative HAT dimerization domain, ribonuclease H-like domain-containing protein n=1 Tax=Rosa chinensis TaxID=74649 RepID=A0A2P6RS55_ROSCH|nr:putative HAT dimerization domain, ribonuclease H-like domain-containing protein [Rosa chinensis]